jgi:transposase-like protein
MMAERGVALAHMTVLRWVQRFMPEFERRWMRFARRVGRSWRVDETYIRVRGQWRYLYRAGDKRGQTVDFRLSEHRDIEAAKAFFGKALLTSGAPMRVTLDGHWPSHRAIFGLRRDARVWRRVAVRTCRYLNNIVE